jgi:photosystem II stability/assembly factor-like uncharacterized protein
MRRCVPGSLSLAISLAVCLVASAASANGRFPRAQRLVESPEDPHLLALYGTYGLIVSSDAGHSWSHVCEAATGPYVGEDPLLEFLPGGRIVARTETSLVRSGATWCDWSLALDGSKNAIQDITRDPGSPSTLLALLGEYDVQSGFGSRLVESTDAGTSWSSPKELPRDQIARGLSLDVAPSDPARVLVSGLDAGGKGRLLVSDDPGGAFQGHAIDATLGGASGATDSASAPYLVAISKTDKNRIFVRTDAYQDIEGIDTANDALLLSTDGGATWATLIQRHAKLFGVALSPDESTLLVGYGDPMESAAAVDPADVGIYRANMGAILADPTNIADAFLKIFDASVTCLRYTESGLFVCTSQGERGFELGHAPGAAFALTNPDPFEARLRLPDVKPLPCARGTTAYACYADPDNGFSSVCAVFGASCDASAPPALVSIDAGSRGPGAPPGAGGGGNGTTGGQSEPSDAGRFRSAGAGGRGGQDAGTVNRSAAVGAPNSGACACRAVSVRPARGPGSLLASVVMVMGLLRRSRRFAVRSGRNPR